MGFKTIIEYYCEETGERLNISPYQLKEWEIKTFSTKTERINIKDYERTIIKTARKSRQKTIEWG